MKLIALATLALLPQLAHAACPTRADLTDGIVLVQNAPFFARADIEAIPGGGLRLDRVERTGATPALSSIRLAHAFAPLEITTDNGRTIYAYDGDPDLFDHIDLLGQHSLAAIVTDAGGTTTPLTIDAQYEGAAQIALAECRYDTWRVRITRASDTGPAEALRLHYAPSLGIVLAATALDPTGESTPDFTYQWIGTASDVAR